MTTLQTVALYHEAWQQKQGDFSDVPLADDFEFTGPVASFDTAECTPRASSPRIEGHAEPRLRDQGRRGPSSRASPSSLCGAVYGPGGGGKQNVDA
jgi:hypothetical protein